MEASLANVSGAGVLKKALPFGQVYLIICKRRNLEVALVHKEMSFWFTTGTLKEYQTTGTRSVCQLHCCAQLTALRSQCTDEWWRDLSQQLTWLLGTFRSTLFFLCCSLYVFEHWRIFTVFALYTSTLYCSERVPTHCRVNCYFFSVFQYVPHFRV